MFNHLFEKMLRHLFGKLLDLFKKILHHLLGKLPDLFKKLFKPRLKDRSSTPFSS